MTNLIVIVECIIMVEGGIGAKPNGDCVGPGQLRPIYVEDVNRILGKKLFTLKDRENIHKTKQMMMIYLGHYSESGWPVQEYALCHKLGPSGREGPVFKRDLDYAERVENLVRDKLKIPKKNVRKPEGR